MKSKARLQRHTRATAFLTWLMKDFSTQCSQGFYLNQPQVDEERWVIRKSQKPEPIVRQSQLLVLIMGGMSECRLLEENFWACIVNYSSRFCCFTYGKQGWKATEIDHNCHEILSEILQQQGDHSPQWLVHIDSHKVVQSWFHFHSLSPEHHNT